MMRYRMNGTVKAALTIAVALVFTALFIGSGTPSYGSRQEEGEDSRIGDNEERNYPNVQLEQGEVELDADFNETVELEGYVIEMTVNAGPGVNTCDALVRLKDDPSRVVVVTTTRHMLQTPIETALANAFAVRFAGLQVPPPLARFAYFDKDYYEILRVTLVSPEQS